MKHSKTLVSRRVFNKTLLGAAAATTLPLARSRSKPRRVRPRPLMLSSNLDDTSMYRVSAITFSEAFNWPDRWNCVRQGNAPAIRQWLAPELFNAYMATMERIRGAGLDPGIQAWIDNPWWFPQSFDVNPLVDVIGQVVGWRSGFDVQWLRDTMQAQYDDVLAQGIPYQMANAINPRGWGDFHSGMATFWLAQWRAEYWPGGSLVELPPLDRIRRPRLQAAALRLGRPVRQMGVLPGPDPDPSCLIDPYRLDCFPYNDIGLNGYPMPLPPPPPAGGDPDPWYDDSFTNPNTPKPRTKLDKDSICWYAGWGLWYGNIVVMAMGSGGAWIAMPEAYAIIALSTFVGGALNKWLCTK